MAEIVLLSVVTVKMMPPVINILDIASWGVNQAMPMASVYKLVSNSYD